MTINFPSSPSNGDTYLYNGVTYVYNSTTDQWIVESTGSSELYVLKTGDTMTGSLTSVGYSGTTGTFSGDLSAAAGTFSGTGAIGGPLQVGTDGASGAVSPKGMISFDSAGASPTLEKPLLYHKQNVGLAIRSDYLIDFERVSGGTPNVLSARIDENGNFKIGGSPDANPNITLNADGSSYFKGEVRVERSSTCVTCITGGGDGTALIYFQTNQPAELGKIRRSGSGVAYDTTSDYRLKENFEPISNAVSRVKSLNPLRFNFIDYPELTVDGFIAHEAKEVVPESVGGTKDEVDSEGKPVYQTIDQSKLVPLLTAALQESITRIEALEAQLSQLTTTGGASS